MNNHQRPIWAINLKKARELMGLTQKEVADKIFRSQWTYGIYESGRCEPSIETWKLLWELFRVVDPLKFWTEEYYEKAA